jgi:hypothetical protein
MIIALIVPLCNDELMSVFTRQNIGVIETRKRAVKLAVAKFLEVSLVREFTRCITVDKDWIVSLAPMRDGMIIAYKS